MLWFCVQPFLPLSPGRSPLASFFMLIFRVMVREAFFLFVQLVFFAASASFKSFCSSLLLPVLPLFFFGLRTSLSSPPECRSTKRFHPPFSISWFFDGTPPVLLPRKLSLRRSRAFCFLVLIFVKRLPPFHVTPPSFSFLLGSDGLFSLFF